MRWLADIVLVDVIEGVPEGKGLDMLDAMLIAREDIVVLRHTELCWYRKFRHVIITAEAEWRASPA